MEVVFMTPYGPATCRVCGDPATTMRNPSPPGEMEYYCEPHNPDGPPCPLCSGTGRLLVSPG